MFVKGMLRHTENNGFSREKIKSKKLPGSGPLQTIFVKTGHISKLREIILL
jgi:hypothetical protein